MALTLTLILKTTSKDTVGITGSGGSAGGTLTAYRSTNPQDSIAFVENDNTVLDIAAVNKIKNGAVEIALTAGSSTEDKTDGNTHYYYYLIDTVTNDGTTTYTGTKNEIYTGDGYDTGLTFDTPVLKSKTNIELKLTTKSGNYAGAITFYQSTTTAESISISTGAPTSLKPIATTTLPATIGEEGLTFDLQSSAELDDADGFYYVQLGTGSKLIQVNSNAVSGADNLKEEFEPTFEPKDMEASQTDITSAQISAKQNALNKAGAASFNLSLGEIPEGQSGQEYFAVILVAGAAANDGKNPYPDETVGGELGNLGDRFQILTKGAIDKGMGGNEPKLSGSFSLKYSQVKK